MNTSQNETTKLAFTAEQRRTLAMLYGFLIQLGRQRLKRLQQSPNETVQAGDQTNACQAEVSRTPKNN